MDAVILSDDNIQSSKTLTPKERLERIIYLGKDENVISKYVDGTRIEMNEFK